MVGLLAQGSTFVHAQALLPNSPSMHAMQLQWQNNNGPYQFINYRLKAIGFNYITVSQALTTQCHSTPGWPKIFSTDVRVHLLIQFSCHFLAQHVDTHYQVQSGGYVRGQLHACSRIFYFCWLSTAFGNRRWLRVHHTKPSTLGWSVVVGVQTNDITHFQKPWTTNLKNTVVPCSII